MRPVLCLLLVWKWPAGPAVQSSHAASSLYQKMRSRPGPKIGLTHLPYDMSSNTLKPVFPLIYFEVSTRRMRARGMCGIHAVASWLKRRYLLYLVAILCLETLIIFQNKSHALVKSTPTGSLISAYNTWIILEELEAAAFETPHFEHALSMTPSKLSKGADKLTSWPAGTHTSRWKSRRMQYYCRFLRQ